jgi:hypothetical protein
VSVVWAHARVVAIVVQAVRLALAVARNLLPVVVQRARQVPAKVLRLWESVGGESSGSSLGCLLEPSVHQLVTARDARGPRVGE